MASFHDSYNLQFQAAGQFLRNLEIPNEDGGVSHMWQLQYFGGSHTIQVPDEIFSIHPKPRTLCRFGGLVLSNKQCKYSLLVDPSDVEIDGITKDMKPIVENELVEGAIFGGIVRLINAPNYYFSDRGETSFHLEYENLGNHYKFSVERDLYLQHHENLGKFYLLRGKVDTKVTSTKTGKLLEVILTPKEFTLRQTKQAAA